jgi:hypothetical protein
VERGERVSSRAAEMRHEPPVVPSSLFASSSAMAAPDMGPDRRPQRPRVAPLLPGEVFRHGSSGMDMDLPNQASTSEGVQGGGGPMELDDQPSAFIFPQRQQSQQPQEEGEDWQPTLTFGSTAAANPTHPVERVVFEVRVLSIEGPTFGQVCCARR